MNWMRLHFGDWATRLDDQDVAVEGMYLRLLRWYYVHEAPLPLDEQRLCEIVHASKLTQKRLLKSTLSNFFRRAEDGWHNDRTDAEIEKVRDVTEKEYLERVLSKHRQRRCRSRRVSLFTTLAKHGIHAPYDSTMIELTQLCITHAIELPVTRDLGSDAERDVIRNHDVHRPSHPREHSLPTVESVGARDEREGAKGGNGGTERRSTPAGEACRAMRLAGIADVNPGHPTLVRLLEQGCSIEELELAAAQCAARGKPFGYALAMVEGRRKDAAPSAFIAGLTGKQRIADALPPSTPPRNTSDP